MKKAIYILFGIFTFSVGFWLFNLRPLVTPVPLCEIPKHTEIYQSKQIYIEAYVDIIGKSEDDFTHFSIFDFSDDCLTGASLIISENLKEQLKNDESLRSFINELRRKNNELRENEIDGRFIGQVEITGSIKKVPPDLETSGIAAIYLPFEVKVTEIKQISPIRFMNLEEMLKLLKFYEQDNL